MSRGAEELIITWLMFAVPCAICGGAAASAKQAHLLGMILGLLFGPFGVIAALGLDGRHFCPTCNGRLNREPKVCMHCRSELYWSQDS